VVNLLHDIESFLLALQQKPISKPESRKVSADE
jgi:hypothetical protein